MRAPSDVEEAVAELAAALFRITRKPLRSSFRPLLELSISEFPKFILGSALRSTQKGRIISGVYGAEPGNAHLGPSMQKRTNFRKPKMVLLAPAS